MRRLGDAAVVFDATTWQTHVLPPAACVVLDFVDECGGPGVASESRVEAGIRASLGLEQESDGLEGIMQTLRELGMFARQ
ncbi:HPr-rel-A system PqqD family peptide chaperone [Cognatazoarcus halotolerans]|uniref:HPr-rel-A system PqqD family peptide chaperone n=1 Tax=Cognatazoarcus halotolerans TaxID=2686016 RepID=UPI00389928F5